MKYTNMVSFALMLLCLRVKTYHGKLEAITRLSLVLTHRV